MVPHLDLTHWEASVGPAVLNMVPSGDVQEDDGRGLDSSGTVFLGLCIHLPDPSQGFPTDWTWHRAYRGPETILGTDQTERDPVATAPWFWHR